MHAPHLAETALARFLRFLLTLGVKMYSSGVRGVSDPVGSQNPSTCTHGFLFGQDILPDMHLSETPRQRWISLITRW